MKVNKEQFVEKYYLDRRNSNSQKWDQLVERFGRDDLISMWVADMDFKTEDKIVEKLKERVEHGSFGYDFFPDEYYEAYSNWMENQYNFPIEREWVRFTNGLVTAITWIINGFTEVGDAVLILTPVYHPFHSAVTNNERKLIAVDLVNHNGSYEMDFDAIEKAIVENDIKLFIQCSPHNPIGRVWTDEELSKILSICEKHNVLVVSDEIHQDITRPDIQFVPAGAASDGAYRDNVIILNAVSKSFNLAGLIHSHVVIPNEQVREQYDNYVKRINQTEPNTLGGVAALAAYQYGETWLKNVNEVIYSNYEYMKEKLQDEFPKIDVIDLQGTYLMFFNLKEYVDPDELDDFMRNKCKLAVSYGDKFGKSFRGFVRTNLATSPEVIKQVTDNVLQALRKL